MDQIELFHFLVKREYEFEGTKYNRFYEFGCQRNAPFDEVQDVFDELKKEFALMKESREKALKEAQELQAAAAVDESSAPAETPEAVTQ